MEEAVENIGGGRGYGGGLCGGGTVAGDGGDGEVCEGGEGATAW
jgi:hypothetical protein